MKTSIAFLTAFFLIIPFIQVFPQEDKSDLENKLETLENRKSGTQISVSDTGIIVEDKSSNKKVKVNNDEIMVVEEGKDTTRIKLGGRGIEIIEGKDGTTRIELKELSKEEPVKPKTRKFKGNFSGIELGLNNYVNSDFSSSLDPSMNFMDLNTNRSVNLNINFIQYDIGFGTDKAGLVTGMGLEFSNYFFDGNNNIRKDENRNIVEYVPSFLDETGTSIIKSKLATTYLTVPLLLEFQIPAGNRRIHISGGIIGGAKLGSNTKIVYRDRGNRQKDKKRDDYNLASLRYGYTLRAGYRGLNLFANYYPVSLFESGKGPELYPYSIGLRLISF